MKLAQAELNHLLFLSDVVLNGNKKQAMEDMLQCFVYIAKSIEEVEVPDSVMERIHDLTSGIEDQLRTENDRMRDIRHNLIQPNLRKPFGK